MTYPPQQGYYGGPPAHYGGYPQPGGPRKSNGPVIAIVIVVVAVLAGLGITGFVAPGFFLNDDKESASDEGGDGGSGDADDAGGAGPPPDLPDVRERGDGPKIEHKDEKGGPEEDVSAEDAEAFATEFLDAVNAKDSAKANGMYCESAPSNSLVDYVISKEPQLKVASAATAAGFLKVELGGTMRGKPIKGGSFSVRTRTSDSPCVYTFTPVG